MKCPKCSGELRVMVAVLLDIPWRYFHNISKSAIRDKDVRIEGVDWPRNTFYCTRCAWFMHE